MRMANIKRLEHKGLRILAKKQARRLEEQAREFRRDALVHAAYSEKDYGTEHPVYEELVAPIVQQLKQVCLDNGFSFITVVHTPTENEPKHTVLTTGQFDDAPETFVKMVELAQTRPQVQDNIASNYLEQSEKIVAQDRE